MNIFYLDYDVRKCAEYHNDKHVVKMILESCQLLSTAHRVLDDNLDPTLDSILYKATHKNHPSAVWARTSVENYNWLYEHFFALLMEYNHRYGKTHKCAGDLSYMLASPPYNLKDYEMTEMPCAMAKEYIISSNPVENYRNYYKNGKNHLHKWTKRERPEWL